MSPDEGARLGTRPPTPRPAIPPVRVVLDARPIQEPDRAPTTAAYLEHLLEAFDADPNPGESFALLLRSDLDDPTERYERLAIVGRRLLPPTRMLGPGALTVDPFLLRGASLGAAWRAGRSGARGAVYHAAAATVPLLSRIPIVVTLLDLAPWQFPGTYQRGAGTRFGQRLRARLLRDAAAVIVAGEQVALDARRLLRIRPSRLHVVPLAARPAFGAAEQPPGSRPETGDPAVDPRAERERLGLPERYFVYAGRFDARQDLGTLLRALAELAAAGRPSTLPGAVPWPPRILLVGATPDDRASIARAAAREGVGEGIAYAPRLDPATLSALVRGARAALHPALSEAAGLAVREAIACGTPVVASAVGVLPELVGAAGILVEPGDARKLASALATAWADDTARDRLAAAARAQNSIRRRTWDDVARETRRVYADVGVGRG